MRGMNWIAALFLDAIIALSVPAQDRSIKLNGGLEAGMIKVARNSDRRAVTVSMRLSNKGSTTAHLLVVGTPIATNDSGDVYGLQTISGLANCSRATYENCVGIPRINPGETVALENYTQIDPGVEIVVNMHLSGNPSGAGPRISMSVDIAYRLGTPEGDSNMTEGDKRKQIRRMTLSFPPVLVNEGN